MLDWKRAAKRWKRRYRSANANAEHNEIRINMLVTGAESLLHQAQKVRQNAIDERMRRRYDELEDE